MREVWSLNGQRDDVEKDRTENGDFSPLAPVQKSDER